MLTALSLFDPLGGIGKDIVGWFGHSISQGIGGFASWAIGGVIHAMQSTTTPDFTSWFKGPWRAMLTVVAWLSLPILFGGVGTAALRGDLASVVRRGLGAPVAMAVGTAVALPVTAGVLTLVNACCSLLVNQALGGDQGFGKGLGHLSDFALSATVSTGGSSLPGLAATLIVALAGLAALVIWFVLALRGALLYLELLAIPLALCGLYWGGTAQWIKRLVDLIIATILSQLVITMLMVLAAADLDNGQLSGSSTGAVGRDITTLFLCLAFLLLGSLALPMALKHVPVATEHAAAAASQISGPGRMSYLGSRVAGTARMLGRNGGSKALVEAGSAAGPVGVAAATGIGAATSAAAAGAKAATGPTEGTAPSGVHSPRGAGSGPPAGPGRSGSGGTAADGVESGTAGAAPGGSGSAARTPRASGAMSPAMGTTASRSPGGPPPPHGPGRSRQPGAPGAAEGAATRASRAPSPTSPKKSGGPRG